MVARGPIAADRAFNLSNHVLYVPPIPLHPYFWAYHQSTTYPSPVNQALPSFTLTCTFTVDPSQAITVTTSFSHNGDSRTTPKSTR